MAVQLATPVSETQAAEYLAETLLKRSQSIIQQNLIKLEKIRNRLGSASTSDETYKSLMSKNKKLRRNIGALVVSDPKASEAMILEMGSKLLDDSSENASEAIVRFIGNRDNRLFKFKAGKGVGHHPTALGILRDALAGETLITGTKGGVPFNVAQELKKLAKRDGINLGEELVAYLDPAAHAAIPKNIKGLLKKKNVTKKDVELLQALYRRSAHARIFGGTTGIPVLKNLITPDMTADQIYKAAKPYLELSQAGTRQGLLLNKLLYEADWNNPKELLKLLNETPLPSSDAILNDIISGLQANNIKVPNTVLGAFTDKKNVPKELLSQLESLPKYKVSAGGLFTPNEELVDVRNISPDLDRNLRTPFAFDGGAAVGVLDHPGLFSGVLTDFMNADKGISNVTNKISSKYNKWILTGGPQRQLSNLARDQYLNVPLTYAFSPEFQENIKQGNYGAAGTQLAVDEAIGRTTWEVGKRVWGSAYAAAPTATTIGSVGLLTGAVGWFQNMADQKVRDKIDPFFTGAFSTGMSFIGGSQLRF